MGRRSTVKTAMTGNAALLEEPASPQTVILVRHGETEDGRPGVLWGRSDPRLSKEGRRQAALLRPLMAEVPKARFLCSPLRRARETAQIALQGMKAALHSEPDLREVDFGRWEGLTYAEAAAQEPAAAASWAQWHPDFGYPGGETFAEFGVRVKRASESLTNPADGPVVAFTHGGVARALICVFLGLSLRDYLLFDVGPGCVAVLRLWGPRRVLAGLGPAALVLREGFP